MGTTHFDTYNAGRANFRQLLDAAAEGRAATVRRDGTTSAVVDAARLRFFLMQALPARVEVVAEADGWSAYMPGLPVSADGATFDEAIDELVDALRDYIADWHDHLRLAPNHSERWPLAQLVSLCDDTQLRFWLTDSQP